MRRNAGFTLVELLVAIAVMATLAIMAWRGIDGMGRAQSQTRAYTSDVLALQSGLAQWGSDLEAMTQLPPVGGIDFDGRVLRITRQFLYDDEVSAGSAAADTDGSGAMGLGGGGSVRVIAWGARVVDEKRQWLRWQSAPCRTRAQLQLAWEQAGQWGQNPTRELMQREVAITGVDEWQVFYYRNNSWTSPLSSAGGSAAAITGIAVTQVPLPDGVRLVLTLSEGQALSGKLTRDWVRPTFGAAGS